MNLDFSETAALRCAEQPWHGGVFPGIEILPLESEGQMRHLHSFMARVPAGRSLPLPGEHAEVFVVSGSVGVGEKECGADSYLRLCTHGLVATAPSVLFVKVGAPYCEEFMLDATAREWLPGEGSARVIPLYSEQGRQTALYAWPGQESGLFDCHFAGTEILLLEGRVSDGDSEYPALSWLRYPHRYDRRITFSAGAKALVKTGHLPLSL